MRLLLCLAGEIASGKTTLADALLHAFPESARAAFGDVVRRRVIQAGVEPDRQSLQDMGRRLVAGGWPSFVGLLAQGVTGDPDVLIVDGIRHVQAVDALQTQFPDRRTMLIFLDSEDQQREARLAERGEVTSSLSHPVELELVDVRDIADLILPATRTTAQHVRCIVDWLETS